MNGENVTYFDSFGVEHIPREIKKFIGKKYYKKYLQNTSLQFHNAIIFVLELLISC